MKHFLDEDSLDRIAMDEISRMEDDDYYVMMAAAWYWAEALSKCPSGALPYFRNDRLDPWIKRKAIQKARESRKIPGSLKSILNGMK